MRYFEIKKTYKLIARKYFLPSFCPNIKEYIQEYNIFLDPKVIKYKFYSNFQFLLVQIY